jgi:hypothetical protein
MMLSFVLTGMVIHVRARTTNGAPGSCFMEAIARYWR